MKPLKKKYHVRTVFSDPSGVGGDGRGFGVVEAWHRKAWEFSPYCVSNELICGEIGRFLRLPIPPFGMTIADDNEYYFTSLNFNFGRTATIPPIHPDLAWKHLPYVCTGILLFDILVANSDRHDKNLAADNVSKPSHLLVFDHDQALFGGGDPSCRGSGRLVDLRNRLGITNGPVSSGNRHCLIDEMNTSVHVGDWLHRIASVPKWFVSDVCDAIRQYGADKADADTARDFLEDRKIRLEDLLKAHQNEFGLVDDWAWKGALL